MRKVFYKGERGPDPGCTCLLTFLEVNIMTGTHHTKLNGGALHPSYQLKSVKLSFQ